MILSRNLREWPIPWIISGGVSIFFWRNSPKGQLEKFRFTLNIVSQRGSYMHTRSSELPPTLQVVLDPLEMRSFLFYGGDISPPTDIELEFITFMARNHLDDIHPCPEDSWWKMVKNFAKCWKISIWNGEKWWTMVKNGEHFLWWIGKIRKIHHPFSPRIRPHSSSHKSIALVDRIQVLMKRPCTPQHMGRVITTLLKLQPLKI